MRASMPHVVSAVVLCDFLDELYVKDQNILRVNVRERGTNVSAVLRGRGEAAQRHGGGQGLQRLWA